MEDHSKEFEEGKKRLQELVETKEEKWELRFSAKTFVFWELLNIYEFWISRIKEAVRRYRSFRVEFWFDPDESLAHLQIHPETAMGSYLSFPKGNAHSVYEALEDHMVDSEELWRTTVFMEIVLKKAAELLRKNEAFRIHLLYDAENLNVRGVVSRLANQCESHGSSQEGSIP